MEHKVKKVRQPKFKAREMPDFSSKPAIVKLNASAVRREDMVYKEKQRKEAELFQAYEQEVRYINLCTLPTIC